MEWSNEVIRTEMNCDTVFQECVFCTNACLYLCEYVFIHYTSAVIDR